MQGIVDSKLIMSCYHVRNFIVNAPNIQYLFDNVSIRTAIVGDMHGNNLWIP